MTGEDASSGVAIADVEVSVETGEAVHPVKSDCPGARGPTWKAARILALVIHAQLML